MKAEVKLSDAIRIGATIRPSGIGDYFTPNKANHICSCALGAAYEAIFGLPNLPHRSLLISEKLAETYTFLRREIYFYCPLEDSCEFSFADGDYTLNRVIAHFNDDHHWTREKIADWLEKKGF